MAAVRQDARIGQLTGASHKNHKKSKSPSCVWALSRIIPPGVPAPYLECLPSPEGGDSGLRANGLLLQSGLHMSLRPLGKDRDWLRLHASFFVFVNKLSLPLSLFFSMISNYYFFLPLFLSLLQPPLSQHHQGHFQFSSGLVLAFLSDEGNKLIPVWPI